MNAQAGNARTGRRRLLIASALMAAIWLVLLPRMSKYGPIESMIERHEAAGIDPSAMFYTELEHLTYRDGMLRHRP